MFCHLNHQRIVHLCNVKEVSPSKRLNSKALIYLFYLFLSWFHNNHNLGHVAARCRRRRVQDHYAERSSQSRYFYGYCFACNMFGHKATDFYRRNMKHVRCYACNKLGHIAKECRNKGWTSHKEKKTSSHLKIWKKKELQLERCGIAQYTNITD